MHNIIIMIKKRAITAIVAVNEITTAVIVIAVAARAVATAFSLPCHDHGAAGPAPAVAINPSNAPADSQTTVADQLCTLSVISTLSRGSQWLHTEIILSAIRLWHPRGRVSLYSLLQCLWEYGDRTIVVQRENRKKMTLSLAYLDFTCPKASSSQSLRLSRLRVRQQETSFS